MDSIESKNSLLPSSEVNSLPIASILQASIEALQKHRIAILQASPGSGKTTIVPLALMHTAEFSHGRILMLEPRRVAAAGAASRMASLLGEEPGQRVGYSVRMERRVSAETKVELLTEGLLTRRLQRDPELRGVSCVIFDEFHERSIHCDLALALLLEIFQLRDDLAILIMSATMDTQMVSDRLEAALGRSVPILHCEAHHWPIDLEYRPASQYLSRGGLVEHAARVIRDELASRQSGKADSKDRPNTNGGDILVFLPGKGEIQRLHAALTSTDADDKDLPEQLRIVQLHGDMNLAAQRGVLEMAPAGIRRVILATNVAESSLTVPGVSCVVDTGLVRIARIHNATGMDRLSLEDASQYSCDQRMGRAGRLGPGRCIRLWSREHPRPSRTEPELLRNDILSLVLECAAWGTREANELFWLDTIPSTKWKRAREHLRILGALDESGALSPKGRRMLELPAHPRLAAMVLHGQDIAQTQLACILAAILSGRDAPGLYGEASLMCRLDAYWGSGLQSAELRAWSETMRRNAQDIFKRLGKNQQESLATDFPIIQAMEQTVAELLIAAWPDRIARRKEKGLFSFPSGRECAISGDLADEQWLLAVRSDSGERTGKIHLAVKLEESKALAALEGISKSTERLVWKALRVSVRRHVYAGRLRLASVHLNGPAAENALRRLLPSSFAERLQEQGIGFLPWGKKHSEALQFWQRAQFYVLHSKEDTIADMSEEALLNDAEEIFSSYLSYSCSEAVLTSERLLTALQERFGWDRLMDLEKKIPKNINLPSGTSRKLDYSQPIPVLSAKAQDLYGLCQTPRIMGVPILIHILSPAMRPVQITSDLEGFWAGTWQEVRKEMRGRYPKHKWPENPCQS